MTTQLEALTVGEIVANDFRAAAVFQRFGIDFCCGGKRSVQRACQAADVEAGIVLSSLAELRAIANAVDDVVLLPLDRLVTHIVESHHSYVRASGVTIAAYLEKLVSVHGVRHPELRQTAQAFGQMVEELLPHMMKEEVVLFPYIKDLVHTNAGACPASPFGTVRNPIRMMEQEHEQVGSQMRSIRQLTHDFTPPADGCTTYRVCFAELERFEADLHRHVHLENNVLFPKAVALEESLGGR